jgi:hypothetical protein
MTETDSTATGRRSRRVSSVAVTAAGRRRSLRPRSGGEGMSERRGEVHWPDVAVGLVAVLIGAVLVGGLVYDAGTTSVTGAEYEAYVQQCADLSEGSRLVDTGLGMETVPLNESDVRTCENTTFGEYRTARLRSMRSTPLNPVQRGWIGGTGILFAAVGWLLLRRQITADRSD